jgi:predicted nucleotidyltransferase
MIDKKKISIIIEQLQKDDRILAVYIMGSAATGGMRPGSDIDLAVLISANKDFTELERLKIASELAFELEIPVDIGEISTKNLVYAKEAVLIGQRIYVRNEPDADLKISTILGMYVVFNEDRKEVLDAYRSR